ncbi:chorismate mutase [Nonomuraea sp. NPDC002799]
MSSTLERRAVAVGDALVGEGPSVVVGRVSLRARHGQADAYEVLREHRAQEGARGRATLVEPFSAADLPAIADLADAVVVGASWTRDIPLVRAAAGLGLPVVVERRPSGSVAEWLGLADYCAAEGDGRVILCEGGRLDLGLVRAARAASGRPVLVDVSADAGLSAAAVAAGADGVVIDVSGHDGADGAALDGAARDGTDGSSRHGGADGVRGGADGAVRGGARGAGGGKSGYAGVVAREFAGAEGGEREDDRAARPETDPRAARSKAGSETDPRAARPEAGSETDARAARPEAGPATDPVAAMRVAEEAVTLVGALLRDEAPATLPECREAIDRVDAALATLLERRATLAGIVQRIKPVGGFAGRDMDRERALVTRMATRAPSLGETRLTPIMNAVIEAGLHLAEERVTE